MELLIPFRQTARFRDVPTWREGDKLEFVVQYHRNSFRLKGLILIALINVNLFNEDPFFRLRAFLFPET